MAITTHGGTTDASDKPTSEASFAASDGWKHEPATSEQAKQMIHYLRGAVLLLWCCLVQLTLILIFVACK